MCEGAFIVNLGMLMWVGKGLACDGLLDLCVCLGNIRVLVVKGEWWGVVDVYLATSWV